MLVERGHANLRPPLAERSRPIRKRLFALPFWLPDSSLARPRRLCYVQRCAQQINAP